MGKVKEAFIKSYLTPELSQLQATEIGARFTLCKMLDRLGFDGVTHWHNTTSPTHLEDELYAAVLAEEERQLKNLRDKTWAVVWDCIGRCMTMGISNVPKPFPM